MVQCEDDSDCDQTLASNSKHPEVKIDVELLEMAVYDSYREEDRQSYSYRYLLDCRTKLIGKLQTCRERIRTRNVRKRNESQRRD